MSPEATLADVVHHLRVRVSHFRGLETAASERWFAATGTGESTDALYTQVILARSDLEYAERTLRDELAHRARMMKR